MANGFLPLLRYLHRMAAGQSGGELTDRQLLDRFVRQQDEAAFGVLLQRHARMVWNVCFRTLRDPHQAEDAFQATFLVLVRKAGSIANGERLANWLYGVAFRVARKARAQASKRQVSQEEVPDMASKGPTDAPWQELSAVLDEEVRRLPVKYREPLVLCYLEGMTNGEAARQLGCPEGTVVTWLARGRERLRQRLQRRGMVLPTAAFAALLAENAASAAVPVALVDSTFSVTRAFLATGQLGWASASVVALTEGVLKDMVLMKLKIAAGVLAATVVLAGSGWAVQQALADKPAAPVAQEPEKPAVPVADAPAPDKKGPHASKLDLTPESFPQIQAAVRPQKQEWAHLRVHWLTDLVAARKKAAKEDKPILWFRTQGQGFNDPLGAC